TAISAGPADEAGQSVSFQVTGDTNTSLFAVAPAVSSTGTLTYALAADAFGSATLTLIAKDDGGTANGGVDTSAPQTFTIDVTGVNDAPSFSVPGAAPTVNEDSLPQMVPGFATAISAGPANESGQSLHFAFVSNSNPSLFVPITGLPLLDSATGDLTYTPAANANGTATIVVKLMDDGGTANGGADTSGTQTFTITVTAVNDAPSFALPASPDQTVLEDSGVGGAHTVAGFATGIGAGPPDESGQTLMFHVTNANNALFSVQPG